MVVPMGSLEESAVSAQNHPGRPQMALKYFPRVENIITSHFGQFWGPLGTPGGPKMVQNITQMAPEVLGGPGGSRFGPNCRQLV